MQGRSLEANTGYLGWMSMPNEKGRTLAKERRLQETVHARQARQARCIGTGATRL